MQKNRAIELRKVAQKIAVNFSRTDRDCNYNNESFEVHQIKPSSESTGIVYLKKNTGKYAMAFCYWIGMGGGKWQYFIPTYDHCIGMESVKEELKKVEERNFGLNFKEDKYEEEDEIHDVLKPFPQQV